MSDRKRILSTVLGIIALLILGFIARQNHIKTARQNIQENLNNTHLQLQQFWKQEEKRLDGLANVLAHQRNIKAMPLVSHINSQEQRKLLLPILEQTDTDLIALFNQQGQSLLHYGQQSNAPLSQTILQSDNPLFFKHENQFYLGVKHPLASGNTYTLLIATHIDKNLLQNIEQTLQRPLALYDTSNLLLASSFKQALPETLIPHMHNTASWQEVPIQHQNYALLSTEVPYGHWITGSPMHQFPSVYHQGYLDLFIAFMICLCIAWIVALNHTRTGRLIYKLTHPTVDLNFDPTHQSLSSEQVEWLIKFSKEPLLSVDIQGYIQQCQLLTAKKMGLNQSPIGMEFCFLFPQAQEWLNTRKQKQFQKEESSLETQTHQGMPIRLLHRSLIIDSGNLVGLLFSISTEEQRQPKQQEIDTLQQQNKTLKNTIQSLQNNQRSAPPKPVFEAQTGSILQEVIDGMVHELKNPLGIMSQGIDYIQDADCSHEQRVEVMKLLQDSIKRMDGTLIGLLGYANPIKIQPHPTHLLPIIEAALKNLSDEMVLENIQFSLGIPQNLPKILADESTLKDMLQALLKNAAQAMVKGGAVEINASIQTLDLATSGVGARSTDYFAEGEEALVLEIKDTGIGIAPDKIDHVMQPFFSTRPSGQGDGLGLPMVKKILEAHRGLFQLISEENKGTCARITLPLAPERTVNGKARILLIDDDVSLCQMTKLNLERTGSYSVTTTYLGQTGVDTAQKKPFDLIITDFNIPDMQGPEIIESIRRTNNQVPILLFSIYHDDETLIDTDLKRKTDGVISKPINQQQMIRTIESALLRNQKSNGSV